MKKRLRIVVLGFTLLLTIGSINGQDKSSRMYKAKSGIIEYELKGKTTGNQIMYFDNHGAKEATYTESETKVLGMTTTENKLSLRLDSVVYDIDLEEMTGVRTVIPFDPSQMTEEQMKEWEEMGKQMMEDMGFEKVGTGDILGKKCEIWEGMGTKIWIWESLTLKTEVNIMGQWITEATRIEVNPNISSSKFKVPDGVEIVDEDYDFGDDDMAEGDEIDALDSVASELGKELEKGLNELKGILGVKKKKKK